MKNVMGALAAMLNPSPVMRALGRRLIHMRVNPRQARQMPMAGAREGGPDLAAKSRARQRENAIASEKLLRPLYLARKRRQLLRRQNNKGENSHV